MTPPNTHLSIPSYVYDTLRAVHESRAKRRNADSIIPHLSNSTIFSMMPDHKALIWDAASQPALTAATLAAMSATVRLPTND